MPPPSKAAIGTRITSYQLTISPLRTPPPRSPMPDPPFKPISIIIRRYIGTYLPGLDRILAKLSASSKKKNTLPSTAHRSLPQRMNQSYLTLQKPLHHLLPPHHLQSSVLLESCKVSSGKHEYAYQSTILALRFPGPRKPPAAIR